MDEVEMKVGKKSLKPYVTIKIDDSVKEFLIKTGWNLNGIFAYGFYQLSGETPPTLKILCKKFSIDLNEARDLYLKFLEKATKEGRMIYEKTLSSVVVYILGKGRIKQEEIAREGGVTPVTIRNIIKGFNLEKGE
jgi:hypothetical protein